MHFVSPAMIVCVCNRISDREITRHAHAGMGFDDIQLELGVATCCGGCEEYARQLVAEHAPRSLAPAGAMAARAAPMPA